VIEATRKRRELYPEIEVPEDALQDDAISALDSPESRREEKA